MSTAAATTDPKYAIAYSTNSATITAQLDTLSAHGPLALEPGHMLVKWLPEAFDMTTVAPKARARQTELNALFIGGALFDADATGLGPHFALAAGRMATFTKDVDEAGFDWTPRPGKMADVWRH